MANSSECNCIDSATLYMDIGAIPSSRGGIGVLSMKVYLLVDQGTEYRPCIVKSSEELKRYASTGTLTIYEYKDIEKDIRRLLRVLTCFGSNALEEIKKGKAYYGEVVVSPTQRPRKLRESIRRLAEAIRI